MWQGKTQWHRDRLRKARATILDIAVAEVRVIPQRPVRGQHLRKLQGLVRLNHLLAASERELGKEVA